MDIYFKMKTKKNELNVDVIGGLGELSLEEEKALNDYFAKKKLKTNLNKKQTNKPSSKVTT